MVTLHQPKSLVKNIVVTPAARPTLVYIWITSKPTSEPILVRNRTNATGFPVRIHPSIKPMIREPRVFLRLSGREKELSGCIQKPTTVLGRRISFLAKELTRNVTRLTKTSIYKCCSQNRIVQVLTEVFVLLTTRCALMSKLGMHSRIFTRNEKFWLMELAPLHSTFKFSSL